jgi:hypothetical protein
MILVEIVYALLIGNVSRINILLFIYNISYLIDTVLRFTNSIDR